MIWWILLAVVVVLAAVMLMRRRKSDKKPIDQRDVDRLRRDSQSRGFGSL
jgi:hypothetical protein